jgi:hypothetical protein
VEYPFTFSESGFEGLRGDLRRTRLSEGLGLMQVAGYLGLMDDI